MKSTDMKLSSEVADRIIALLESGPTEPAEWAKRVRGLESKWGLDVYVVLLFVLTHLEFSGTKAREHWGRVLRQWEQLNLSLPDEVDLRVAVLHYFLRIQRKLRNPAIVELKILRRTEDSAIVDELTRLYNFRFFQDRLREEAKRAEREGSTLAMLMVDADDFKVFNDTRGHLAGNVALRRLAGVLKRSVRETDVVARYGGEEFAVLLPNTPKVGALKAAEKARRAVEKAGIGRDRRGKVRPLTVSIGLATLPGDAATAEELVERADRALYVAKSMGKNCVRPFSDERREFSRLDASLPGHFNLVESRSHALTTLNLSEGGLLFLSQEPIPPDVLLQVQLTLPAGEPIEGVVRVIRIVPAPAGYQVGTQIVHMPARHQRRFRVFLHGLKTGTVDPRQPQRWSAQHVTHVPPETSRAAS